MEITQEGVDPLFILQSLLEDKLPYAGRSIT